MRAISEDFHSKDMVDIILDRGSDTAALPKNFQGVGNDVQPSHHCVYYDAQGGQLQVQQHKRAQVQVGNMKLVDDFIVTDVSNPILPLGKLLRAGFTLAHEMYLSCGHMRAPVHFRRNSLCIRGFIRHIPSRDASAVSEEVARDEYVRTVVISEPLQYLGCQTYLLSISLAWDSKTSQISHTHTQMHPISASFWMGRPKHGPPWASQIRNTQNLRHALEEVEPPERMNTFFPTLTVHVSGLTMNRQTHLGFECFHIPHTFGLGRDGGFLSNLTRGSENFWGRPMGACSSRLRRARQQALRNWCRLVHNILYSCTAQLCK